MRGVLMIVAVLLADVASAQTKPIGLFDPGLAPPAWASFGTISDTVSDDRLRDAAALCRARSFRYVLQVGYHEHPATPIGPHAARVRARLDAAGLTPCVIAMSIGEEWYEYFYAGEFTRFGLPPTNPAGVPMIHDWLGRQHLAAKAALGLPVVWITTVLHPVYRPEPAHVDVVALDPYVWPGQTFQTAVAPILRLAEESTTKPLVVIPQWFHVDGFERPNPLDVAQYFQWLERPRWIALMGFTWQSRANGITGLVDLPAVRAAVEARIR